MLVLTRKVEESVVIGSPGTSQLLMTVTVIGIEGAKVRLGFQADPSIPVYRREVWQRMHPLERLTGTTTGPPDQAGADALDRALKPSPIENGGDR